MLLHALEDVGLACVHAAPGLFFVVVIFFITRLLVRAIGLFFHAIEEERITVPGLHADTALPTRRIVVVIVWVLALAVAYPFLPGSKSEAFKGISVLFGIMISLGSSGTINQLASGLTLMYSRALRVGDYVQIQNIEGTVTGMSLLTVRIRTVKRVEVSIPNAVVVAAETKNYSRLGGREGVIVHSTVTIGYSAPWRQVHAMLIQAAQRTAGIKKQPVPFVHQTSLDDFYVSYQVNGHLEDPHTRLRVLADLHRHIQDVFNEYGVQIMSPHYENDPATGSPVVPKSRWYAAPATPEADAGTPPDA
jgi:small-conductance mechanosensitive channel